ncbi:hypothetical protein [Nocardia transvalensis]|uniref:hypothetical protein n=1 Tax=Nocardia transvalensis TaxID=37333 RepID=UPI0018937E65|nr:hypothetical protein [Nocardia transvalensis]MBF6333523.1 hypothetical protein [Nocardia transvalensis]
MVHPARWALVLHDCCGIGLEEGEENAEGTSGPGRGIGPADIPVDVPTSRTHLVCKEHFLEIVTQPLPGVCPNCGHVSRSITDIVDWAMTLQEGFPPRA